MNFTTHLDGDDDAPIEPSDAQIVEAVRGGDIGDFALLWRRHVDAARRAARAISPSSDPDDLVSEAFASILRVTKAGGGPSDAFRPYLLATLRNTAARWSRGSGLVSIEVVSERDLAHEGSDPIERISERSSVAAVFGKLSARHRTLLWYLEVEGMKPRELAPLLGITPNAVSALALRARDSFRRAWLEAHIHDPSRAEDCRWFCQRVVAQRERPVRGEDAKRFRGHMSTCRGCQLVAAEIDTVSQRLRSILPVAMFGSLAAGLYAADGEAAAADVALDAEPWTHLAGALPHQSSAVAGSPEPLTESILAASHAAMTAKISAGGVAAWASASLAVVGAVVVAGALVGAPAVPADSAESTVESSSTEEERTVVDEVADLSPVTTADLPDSLDLPKAPEMPENQEKPEHHLVFTTDVVPSGSDEATPAPTAAEQATAPPPPPRPTPPRPTPPNPLSPTQPLPNPMVTVPPEVDSEVDAATGSDVDATGDSLSVDPSHLRVTQNNPPGARLPPLLGGTDAPGALATVCDEQDTALDEASVVDRESAAAE